MRILVTGGTGFLGRHLLPLLQDHEVFALTRRPITSPGRHVTWIEAPFSEGLDVARLPAQMDAIIHLAQSERYREFPGGAPDVFQVNVATPQTLMQWALTAGVTRAVFASTGTVYEPFTLPMREDVAVNPTGYYGASKLACETLTLAYQAQIAVSQLRVFFLYGPSQAGMMISRVIDNVRAGATLTLPATGDGLVFVPTYVEDTAGVFKQACEEGWRGVWNVASPQAVSFKALADEIGLAVDRRPIFARSTGDAPVAIVPDMSKLATKVDLAAFTPLPLGLARTVQWTAAATPR
jgi:UDP-glucose 4-epimerase